MSVIPAPELDAAADLLSGLCRALGYDILRYPENISSYMKKRLDHADDAVDAIVRVLMTEGCVDSLMWCRYYAREPERMQQCADSYAELVARSASENGQVLADVFRRLAEMVSHA